MLGHPAGRCFRAVAFAAFPLQHIPQVDAPMLCCLPRRRCTKTPAGRCIRVRWQGQRGHAAKGCAEAVVCSLQQWRACCERMGNSDGGWATLAARSLSRGPETGGSCERQEVGHQRSAAAPATSCEAQTVAARCVPHTAASCLLLFCWDAAGRARCTVFHRCTTQSAASCSTQAAASCVALTASKRANWSENLLPLEAAPNALAPLYNRSYRHAKGKTRG